MGRVSTEEVRVLKRGDLNSLVPSLGTSHDWIALKLGIDVHRVHLTVYMYKKCANRLHRARVLIYT